MSNFIWALNTVSLDFCIITESIALIFIDSSYHNYHNSQAYKSKSHSWTSRVSRQIVLNPLKCFLQILLFEELVPHDWERAPQLVVAALLGDVGQEPPAQLDPTLQVVVREADPAREGSSANLRTEGLHWVSIAPCLCYDSWKLCIVYHDTWDFMHHLY